MSDADPRTTGDYVRHVSRDTGTLTLVGVVHDHPASVYRACRTIERTDPDTLALELPPISVPLFEQYADGSRDPPAFGGEMSAAIRAADTDTVLGIDRPTGGFVRRLLGDVYRMRPSLTTLREVLADTASTATHALVCRFAAAVAGHTSMRVEVDSPVEHDVNRGDTPEAQARDERRQVRRARSFITAFRTDSATRASQFGDTTREAHMAARLRELRGDTVAVIGIQHLDTVAERLADEQPPDNPGLSGSTNE